MVEKNLGESRKRGVSAPAEKQRRQGEKEGDSKKT